MWLKNSHFLEKKKKKKGLFCCCTVQYGSRRVAAEKWAGSWFGCDGFFDGSEEEKKRVP